MADENAQTTGAAGQASTGGSNPFQNIADRQAAANLTMGGAYDRTMVDESVVHSAGTAGANRRLNLNQMIDGVDRLGTVTDDIADQVGRLQLSAAGAAERVQRSMEALKAAAEAVAAQGDVLDRVQGTVVDTSSVEAAAACVGGMVDDLAAMAANTEALTTAYGDVRREVTAAAAEGDQLAAKVLADLDRVGELADALTSLGDYVGAVHGDLRRVAEGAQAAGQAVQGAAQSAEVMGRDLHTILTIVHRQTEALDQAGEQQRMVNEQVGAQSAYVKLLTEQINSSAQTLESAKQVSEQYFRDVTTRHVQELFTSISASLAQVEALRSDPSVAPEVVAKGVSTAIAAVVRRVDEFRDQASFNQLTVDKQRLLLDEVRRFGERMVTSVANLSDGVDAEARRTDNQAMHQLAESMRGGAAEIQGALVGTLEDMGAQVHANMSAETDRLRVALEHIGDPDSELGAQARVNLGMRQAGAVAGLASGGAALDTALNALTLPERRRGFMDRHLGLGGVGGRERLAESMRTTRLANAAAGAQVPELVAELKKLTADGRRDPGTKAAMSAVLKRLTEVVGSNAQAHLDTGRRLNLTKGQYRLLGEDDKRAVDSYLKSVESARSSLTAALRMVEDLDPADTESINRITQLRDELGKMNEDVEKLRDSSPLLADSARRALAGVQRIKGLMAGGLAMMGLGALAPTLGNVKSFGGNAFTSYAEDGRRRYRMALTDAYLGVDLNEGRADHFVNDLADKYFKQTYGQVGFDRLPDRFNNLARAIGGRRGATQQQTADDLAWFTEKTFGFAEVMGISEGTLGNAGKVLYRDLGMTAQETAGAIARMGQTAQQANIPVERYVSTVTGMADRLRDVGMDGRRVMGVMDNLVHQGLRIEDASDLVQGFASANANMAGDWNQSAFWGMMTGQGADPFGNVLTGLLSHDAKGMPIDGYFDMMAQRVIARNQFMGAMGGGPSSDLGAAMMYQDFVKQGFSRARASQLTSAARSGDQKLLASLWKEAEGEKDGYQKALNTAMTSADEALSKAADQLSAVTKALSARQLAEKQVGEQIRTKLGEPLNKFADGVGSFMKTVTEKVTELLKKVKEFFDSDAGKAVGDWVDEHKTTAALLAALGVGALGSLPMLISKGLGLAAKGAIGAGSWGFRKVFGGGAAVAEGAAAVGAAGAEGSKSRQQQRRETQMAEKAARQEAARAERAARSAERAARTAGGSAAQTGRVARQAAELAKTGGGRGAKIAAGAALLAALGYTYFNNAKGGALGDEAADAAQAVVDKLTSGEAKAQVVLPGGAAPVLPETTVDHDGVERQRLQGVEVADDPLRRDVYDEEGRLMYTDVDEEPDLSPEARALGDAEQAALARDLGEGAWNLGGGALDVLKAHGQSLALNAGVLGLTKLLGGQLTPVTEEMLAGKGALARMGAARAALTEGGSVAGTLARRIPGLGLVVNTGLSAVGEWGTSTYMQAENIADPFSTGQHIARALIDAGLTTVGMTAGGLLGGAVGSVAGPAGTVAGGLAGGAAGYEAGAALAERVKSAFGLSDTKVEEAIKLHERAATDSAAAQEESRRLLTDANSNLGEVTKRELGTHGQKIKDLNDEQISRMAAMFNELKLLGVKDNVAATLSARQVAKEEAKTQEDYAKWRATATDDDRRSAYNELYYRYSAADATAEQRAKAGYLKTAANTYNNFGGDAAKMGTSFAAEAARMEYFANAGDAQSMRAVLEQHDVHIDKDNADNVTKLKNLYYDKVLKERFVGKGGNVLSREELDNFRQGAEGVGRAATKGDAAALRVVNATDEQIASGEFTPGMLKDVKGSLGNAGNVLEGQAIQSTLNTLEFVDQNVVREYGAAKLSSSAKAAEDALAEAAGEKPSVKDKDGQAATEEQPGEEAPKPTSPTCWYAPVDDYSADRVSSPFGMRTHPIHGDQRMHKGIDITGASGAAVRAAAAGTVESVTPTSESGGYGNLVILRHDDGSQSYYAHLLDGSTEGLKVGQRVKAGQQIGAMGSTGDSTGDHLHFEVHNAAGELVDPATLIAHGMVGEGQEGPPATTGAAATGGQQAGDYLDPESALQGNWRAALGAMNSVEGMSMYGGADVANDRIATGRLVIGGVSTLGMINGRGLANARGVREDLYRYSGIQDFDRFGYSLQGAYTVKDGKATVVGMNPLQRRRDFDAKMGRVNFNFVKDGEREVRETSDKLIREGDAISKANEEAYARRRDEEREKRAERVQVTIINNGNGVDEEAREAFERRQRYADAREARRRFNAGQAR